MTLNRDKISKLQFYYLANKEFMTHLHFKNICESFVDLKKKTSRRVLNLRIYYFNQLLKEIIISNKLKNASGTDNQHFD